VFLKPDTEDETERKPPGGLTWIPGPNHNTYEVGATMDFDVGALVEFRHPVESPEAGVRDLGIRTLAPNPLNPMQDVPLGDMIVDKVRLVGGIPMIWTRQGLSSKTNGPLGVGEGYIVVLGVRADDDIYVTMGSYGVIPSSPTAAMAGYRKTWLCGVATVGEEGVSRCGNRFDAASLDTAEIAVRAVEGHYPLVCRGTWSDDTLQFYLDLETAFGASPRLDLTTGGGHANSYALTQGGQAYRAEIPDSLATSGTFNVWAVDSVGTPFFASIPYQVTSVDSAFCLASGPGAKCQVLLSDSAHGEDVMIMTSAYPVITTGLPGATIQAGEAHCVVDRSGEAALTGALLELQYLESQLELGDYTSGDERLLQLYLWDEATRQWSALTSDVDTVNNVVRAEISAGGTYAAFTSDIVVGVEDDHRGGTLPDDFELQPNYPNPFNPSTTISYSLPEAAHVRIEVCNVLGQKVRTLVNTVRPAGEHQARWDGTDESGSPVASGVYLYRFQSSGQVVTRKMLLLR
jgi:hypothetical protein